MLGVKKKNKGKCCFLALAMALCPALQAPGEAASMRFGLKKSDSGDIDLYAEGSGAGCGKINCREAVPFQGVLGSGIANTADMVLPSRTAS